MGERVFCRSQFDPTPEMKTGPSYAPLSRFCLCKLLILRCTSVSDRVCEDMAVPQIATLPRYAFPGELQCASGWGLQGEYWHLAFGSYRLANCEFMAWWWRRYGSAMPVAMALP